WVGWNEEKVRIEMRAQGLQLGSRAHRLGGGPRLVGGRRQLPALLGAHEAPDAEHRDELKGVDDERASESIRIETHRHRGPGAMSANEIGENQRLRDD